MQRRVGRLAGMAGIGVDRMAARADRAADPDVLRLENLDTDLPPPPGVVAATRAAVGRDEANSYLPFVGTDELRRAAAARVAASAGVDYPWSETTLITAGGLAGILNVLLAVVEPGDEVVLPDPIYVGLVNRVRLAGGVPRFLRYEIVGGSWRLDRSSVAAAVSARTRAFLLMSPAMPSGAVLTRGDWTELCAACDAAGAWMIVDAAMERILFDGAELVHPASFPGMAERTVTVGSVSKEQRMIGWRVGWIVAPPALVDDVGLVAISNVVTPVGIAQRGAATALAAPASDLAGAVSRWRRRRDAVLAELAGFPVVRPAGGWSLLLDATALGLGADEACERLFARGRVAATPMAGWGGERSARFVRLVFSNEPVARLAGLGARVARAFA